ncbi:hypothetical protein PRIPAC_90206 [Pristionchus pacificus]|uniref:Uncharacterized protein n=1 Tax=Pristionchus pacificus TaxID=54126 RepID=A0A2A6B5M0_PRIPA|nr:hypothetical protein PRIPAC_90206 [Pristionchus pacificus]|eukprot:PDM61176.1 hypothetical protein PRIPAC_50618 [Pristionchus pacificus]
MKFSILPLLLLWNGVWATFSDYHRPKSNCDESPLADIASSIMRDIDQDTRELISTGNWPVSRAWSTSILLLSEEAYLTAIQAFRELLSNNSREAHEFSELSAALTVLRPQYAAKRRKLAESRAATGETRIVIPFSMQELFEAGSREATKLSFTYLPAIGIVFNSFPSEYAEEMAANHGLDIHSKLQKMNELMRLQVKATRDRISFAVMSIMFAECWAFSQIQEIEKAETIKSLNSFKGHVGRAVRLMQKKYGVAARLIGEREEL